MLVCAMWRVPRSTVYARRADETGLNGDALQRPQTNDRDSARCSCGRVPRAPLRLREAPELFGELAGEGRADRPGLPLT